MDFVKKFATEQLEKQRESAPAYWPPSNLRAGPFLACTASPFRLQGQPTDRSRGTKQQQRPTAAPAAAEPGLRQSARVELRRIQRSAAGIRLRRWTAAAVRRSAGVIRRPAGAVRRSTGAAVRRSARARKPVWCDWRTAIQRAARSGRS